MKFKIHYSMLFLLMGIIAIGQASGKVNPDIIVYSKMEKKWNVFMTNQTRTILDNFSITGDPIHFVNANDIVYLGNSIGQSLPSGVNSFIQDIEHTSHLDILSLTPEVIISELSYDVHEVVPTINVENISDDTIVFATELSLRGTRVGAKKIELNLLLPESTKKNKFAALKISIINPEVLINKDIPLDFSADIKLKERTSEDKINFDVDNINFDKFYTQLESKQDQIQISWDSIQIPKVEFELEIGGRVLEVNLDVLHELIAANMPKIKTLLIGQFKKLLGDGAMVEHTLGQFLGNEVDSKFWFETESDSMLPFFLKAHSFTAISEKLVSMEFDGDFCTVKNYVENESNCVNTKELKVEVSTITEDIYEQSVTNIMDKLGHDDTKFLASISEDYINKIVATTVEDGLWDEALAEMGGRLGDRNIFVKFDESGPTATIIIDLIFDIPGMKGFLLGEKHLRMPVILKVSPRLEYKTVNNKNRKSGKIVKQEQINLLFNVTDVVIDEDIILNGYPKYNMPSTMRSVRRILRKKILKIIRKEVFEYKAPSDPQAFANWIGTELPIKLELPELNKLHLEKMNIESDGLGRLNLSLNQSEVLEE